MGRIRFIITPQEYAEKAVQYGESEMREMVKKGVYKIVDDNPPPKKPIDLVSLLEETAEKYYGEHVFEDIVADAKAAYEKQRRRR